MGLRQTRKDTLPWTRMRACHWFLRLLLPTPMKRLVRCLLLKRLRGTLARSLFSVALTYIKIFRWLAKCNKKWVCKLACVPSCSSPFEGTALVQLPCKDPLHLQKRRQLCDPQLLCEAWCVQACKCNHSTQDLQDCRQAGSIVLFSVTA